MKKKNVLVAVIMSFIIGAMFLCPNGLSVSTSAAEAELKTEESTYQDLMAKACMTLAKAIGLEGYDRNGETLADARMFLLEAYDAATLKDVQMELKMALGIIPIPSEYLGLKTVSLSLAQSLLRHVLKIQDI